MNTVLQIFVYVWAAYFCIIGGYAGYTYIRDDQRRERERKEEMNK